MYEKMYYLEIINTQVKVKVNEKIIYFGDSEPFSIISLKEKI